jgi:four helix bundle protein
VENDTFHKKLHQLIGDYAFEVYLCTKTFPRDEIFGITSQLRRSALSVALNYIEGFSRSSKKSHKVFLETSFGSLKESLYLLSFSNRIGYLDKPICDKLTLIGNEIGAMLWGILRKMD